MLATRKRKSEIIAFPVSIFETADAKVRVGEYRMNAAGLKACLQGRRDWGYK